MTGDHSSPRKPKLPKPPKQIPRKEHHARLSYLYQISTLMAARSESSDNEKDMETLSRVYARNLDIVSKKAVLKLSPTVKRSICKKCHRRQIEGITMSTRLSNPSKKKTKNNDIMECSCKCGETRRFPIGKNPDFTPFHEREDHVVAEA
ncbi:unnamed protein product [Kuraishia capsulata CBS 1993]|uniref:Rpr2-domain-containing protein n=1 Tax=Kuraishia capsulata CBS 1993 TaxID=1382522 RepID=W6MML0_9ASCO|nr:uncharacterized protein KUCA_T00003775001 [Kuraishia capsulata CBS 1993]CDK27796.1 unnamed protein product [Kuraishia capsulata CBS 1993]